MGIKSLLIKPYAKLVANRVERWSRHAIENQQQVLWQLTSFATFTQFGKAHQFDEISDYQDFKQAVPIADYEQQKKHFDAVAAGEADVLWPGKPKYLAKTSGTTSGTKYIPITRESVGNHFYTAQAATLNFMAQTGKYHIMDGRMIFLSGSPQLENKNGIALGRLSGIVNHQIPPYLKGNQLPTWQTNCMDDWEAKLDAIVEETYNKDLRLISGIAPWVQMYFDKLVAKTGKPIKDIFPNFEAFVYGGVNYEPYRAKLEQTIGKSIPSIETYPASEGFLAFQDSQDEPGLLLNTNSGIFFEFVPADELYNENPTRVSLADVKKGINYALIINSNAGLWGYSIGDTVKFVSIDPYRLIVTGRVKHFISAFGEHVIGEEVEAAMQEAARAAAAEVVEFTVAPKVEVQDGLPHHEWYIEFGNELSDLEAFSRQLDEGLRKRNAYYDDLIKGQVLCPLKIRRLQKHAFVNYMKAQGKLGGQNKVPRLANDRKIADALQPYTIG